MFFTFRLQCWNSLTLIWVTFQSLNPTDKEMILCVVEDFVVPIRHLAIRPPGVILHRDHFQRQNCKEQKESKLKFRPSVYNIVSSDFNVIYLLKKCNKLYYNNVLYIIMHLIKWHCTQAFY